MEVMDQQKALAEVHRQVIERFPMYQTHPAFEHWLLEKSGGDPGKIVSYLNVVEDYGVMNADGLLDQAYTGLPEPEAVEREIERHLTGLDTETLRLLKIGSVEGKHFTLEIVAAIAGIDPAEAQSLLRPAESTHLIVRDGTEELYAGFSLRYHFHPLQLQEYLYHRLSDEERHEYHRQMVTYLSDVIRKVEDEGSRELISSMIALHNARFSRPSSSPAKS